MYIRSTLVTLLFVLMRSYTSTLHNNKQYTVYKTQTGCSHAYVDHRYVFTIYSTVEDLGGLMGHIVMIEGTENGSLFQVYINDILKIMYM